MHDQDTDESNQRCDGQRALIQTPREYDIKIRRPLPQNINTLYLRNKQIGDYCQGQARGGCTYEPGMCGGFAPGKE